MDVELALKINRLVHNECKDVPHDIGIRIEELVRLHQSELKNCTIPVVKVRYLLIKWLNGDPIIDGCMHFDTKDECLEYYKTLPKIGGVEYTVCRTNAP